MACASTNNCSSCSGANCSGGCQGGCNGCSGCGSSCGTNCSGGCKGTCQGCQSCTGGCGGTCKTTCSGCDGGCEGCTGSCSSSCKGACKGCEGSCKGTCQGDCGSDCTGGCSGDCSTACNATCTGQTQSSNLAKLNLSKKFEANNIQDIADFIEFEIVNRRGITTVLESTFTQAEKLDEEKINNIISNLTNMGYEIPVLAEETTLGSRLLGEALIKKAIEANKEPIYL